MFRFSKFIFLCTVLGAIFHLLRIFIRSPKLGNIKSNQYLGGCPLANTTCCYDGCEVSAMDNLTIFEIREQISNTFLVGLYSLTREYSWGRHDAFYCPPIYLLTYITKSLYPKCLTISCLTLKNIETVAKL